LKKAFLLTIVILNCAAILIWLNLNQFIFSFVVISSISIFSNYLSKESEFIQFVGLKKRKWNDLLVLTSLAYFIDAIFAYYHARYNLSLICFITFIGSSLYHRNREMKYFNLDSIFATSLLIIYIYTFYTSEIEFDTLHCIGILSLAIAIVAFILCGMPAQILIDEITGCCCGRVDRFVYNKYHAIWHILSSLAPVLSILYINSIEKSLNKEDIDALNNFEFVFNIQLPIIAVLFGIVLNVSGNIKGFMPLK
jgi:hypothetical protein